jgi:pimeloyl-ACP methyl ester carboxylesterase
VLVIHGSADHLVPVAFARAGARAHADWMFHEVPGGGHRMHHDQPDQWAAIVRTWLADPF